MIRIPTPDQDEVGAGVLVEKGTGGTGAEVQYQGRMGLMIIELAAVIAHHHSPVMASMSIEHRSGERNPRQGMKMNISEIRKGILQAKLTKPLEH